MATAIRDAAGWLELRHRLGLDVASALALLVLERALAQRPQQHERHLRQVAEVSAEGLRAVVLPGAQGSDVGPLLDWMRSAVGQRA